MAYRLYIDGIWRDAVGGGTRQVLNPATSEPVGEFAFGGVADALTAMDAAERAFPLWKAVTAHDRAAVLKRAADLIRERCAEIARLVTRENGKPLPESEAETLGCAGWFEWFAEEAKRNYGRHVPTHSAGKRIWTIQQPVGVVVAVTPWNFPVNLMCRKLAAALAAGCTAVCRAASETPLSAMTLFECLHEAGIPRGAANLITGDGASTTEAMMNHRACRKLSFTGSTAVGKRLMAQAAPRLIRLSLELGGHAPLIVFPDVDVTAAAEQTVLGKFRNAGQSCISPSRIYVHRSIYARFREAVAERTRTLRVGDGLDPGVEMGPLLNEARFESTAAFLKDAVEKGATTVAGGRRLSGGLYDRGFFFEPTVLENVPTSARLTCEEIFGPILPLFPFDTEEEAVALANDTNYGLAAYVLTRELGTAIRVSEAREFGIVGVNDTVPAVPYAPFGGWKESGMGREGGSEGLQAYLETKFISLGTQ